MRAAALLLASLTPAERAEAWRLTASPAHCAIAGCFRRRDGEHALCAGHLKRKQRHGDVFADIPLGSGHRLPKPAPAGAATAETGEGRAA